VPEINSLYQRIATSFISSFIITSRISKVCTDTSRFDNVAYLIANLHFICAYSSTNKIAEEPSEHPECLTQPQNIQSYTQIIEPYSVVMNLAVYGLVSANDRR